MGEHPNATAARRAYEAFSTGDVEALRGLWADDIVFHVIGVLDLDGDYVGHDAVFGFFARLAQATGGSFRLDVHAIVADDEHAVTLLHQHAEREGRSFEGQVVHVAHMRDGKTREFWSATTDPVAAVAFWT